METDELKAWRKRNKYTQEQAAKFLDYSVSHYRKMEYGMVGISDRVRLLDRLLPE
jgi:transcriptional regulator with XRE-family HTH domain